MKEWEVERRIGKLKGGSALEFMHAYVEAEYALRVMAHTDRDSDRFFAACEAFDAEYFAPGLASTVSRPGNMDDDAFDAFKEGLQLSR